MKIWKAAFAAVVVSLIGLATASAQNWPSRPIKIVVPFPPGGSTDIIGRLAADQLGRDLGQPVVVENVGGAAGAIGTMQVERAPADGYTLAIATVSTMIVYQSAQASVEQGNACPAHGETEAAIVGRIIRVRDTACGKCA